MDTGPVVAYLDAGDPAHADVAERWDSFRGQLVTTSAVITEAMHFVSATPSGARHLADLVAARREGRGHELLQLRHGGFQELEV